MATARKPFKVDGESTNSVRGMVGRAARDNAAPANPLDEQNPTNVQRTMSGWAPGIGQGSAAMTGQSNPYQPIAPKAPGFKLD